MKLEQEKTDADENGIDIKLEVEDDDYLNFDGDLMTNEIKYEGTSTFIICLPTVFRMYLNPLC